MRSTSGVYSVYYLSTTHKVKTIVDDLQVREMSSVRHSENGHGALVFPLRDLGNVKSCCFNMGEISISVIQDIRRDLSKRGEEGEQDPVALTSALSG